MKKHTSVYFSVMLVIVLTLFNIPSLYAQAATSTGKMKFLVIAENKDIYYSMSADERKKIDDATSEWAKKAVKAGDFIIMYAVPGWNRSVSIEQYDSIEHLYSHFEGAPIYPYINFEVYPLYDAGETELAKPDAKKMKFLTICKPKDVWYSIPEDERKKIEGETTPETGNFLEFYSIPGWYSYVAIEQYDSIESLYKHFESDPKYPLATFEVYPLVEIDLTQ